jgi:hypothetical protein
MGDVKDKAMALLDSRLALRPEEAAAAIGVSERSIRKHMAEIPHAYLGRSILIPVDSLRTWLKEGVGRNQGRDAEIEGEILTAICSGDENS